MLPLLSFSARMTVSPPAPRGHLEHVRLVVFLRDFVLEPRNFFERLGHHVRLVVSLVLEPPQDLARVCGEPLSIRSI